MKFTKALILALVLALFVCAFAACGDGTDTETNLPGTDSETDAPVSDTEDPGKETEDPGEECKHELEVEEKLATCTDRGYKKEVCKLCGETVSETAYPKAAHTPTAAATCTEDSKCSVCGEVLEAAKGHTFGDAVVVDATCLVDGSKTQKCSTCGESVVEKTQAFAHRIPAENVTNSVAPTCSTDGSVTGTCTLCNKVQTVAIPAAHTFGADDFSFDNLSFDEEGNVTAQCSVCGQSAVAVAAEMFSLTFDEFKPDHVWNTGAEASVRNGRLYLPANPCPIYTFDASLLEDSDVYMISFDYRRTSTNETATSVQGIFGLATVKADGTPASAFNFALTIQRGSFEYCDGATGLKTAAEDHVISDVIATNDANTLDKIVIVVDNTNSNSYVYVNGVFLFHNENANFLVDSSNLSDGQSFAWRFGGNYNLNISPEYDNFKVCTLDTVTE